MNNSQNEIEVMIPKGCDNAPRKQIMITFTVACLKQDTDTIERYAHEAIVWEQLRENKIIEGLPSFNQALQVENDQTVTGLEIDQVITHGKSASINGIISLNSGEKIDFCDVYTFSSAAKSGKVKEIKSYRV